MRRAAAFLSGASEIENADPAVVDKLEQIKLFRVNVNHPGRGASTLFTPYQMATIADYRENYGDILSAAELMLVDGFSKDVVEILLPFLDFSPTPSKKVSAQALLRVTQKNTGVKAHAGGELWEASGALRGEVYTLSAWAKAGKISVVAGDYNLRYGQGLVLWTGFNIESVSSPEALFKRPTGISPVCSFLPSSCRGAALEYSGKRLGGAIFCTLDGFYGARAEYGSLNGNVGLTLSKNAISLDGRYNYHSLVAAFEAAVKNGSAAGKATVSYRIRDATGYMQIRAVPSSFSGKRRGDYALAAGLTLRSLSFLADASLTPYPLKDPSGRQLRLYGDWKWKAGNCWDGRVYYTGRYRSYEQPRNSLRLDQRLSSGIWTLSLREEALYCGGPGGLFAAEGSVKWKSMELYLRLAAWKTAGWASRIYCYERDAPGNFSVPAYYGQGVRPGLFIAWKPRFKAFTAKMYLKIGEDVRFQLTFSLP